MFLTRWHDLFQYGFRKIFPTSIFPFVADSHECFSQCIEFVVGHGLGIPSYHIPVADQSNRSNGPNERPSIMVWWVNLPAKGMYNNKLRNRGGWFKSCNKSVDAIASWLFVTRSLTLIPNDWTINKLAFKWTDPCKSTKCIWFKHFIWLALINWSDSRPRIMFWFDWVSMSVGALKRDHSNFLYIFIMKNT